MIYKKKYAILLGTFIACTCMAMEDNDLQVQKNSPRITRESAKGIAQDIWNMMQIRSVIWDEKDIEKVHPEQMRETIIACIEELHLTEDENDHIFDAYMALHHIEKIFSTAGKFLAYKFSRDGKNIAYAEQESDGVTLHVAQQNARGIWDARRLFSNKDDTNEYTKNLENIFWSANNNLYTVHDPQNGKARYALGWQERAENNYSIGAQYIPHNWQMFFKQSGIIAHATFTNSESTTVCRINDTSIKVKTVVSSVDMMNTYLEEDFKRKLAIWQAAQNS